jgi:hypothetical protein
MLLGMLAAQAYNIISIPASPQRQWRPSERKKYYAAANAAVVDADKADAAKVQAQCASLGMLIDMICAFEAQGHMYRLA